MEEKLSIFFEEFSLSETVSVISLPKFSESISRNKDSLGNHFFRIRDGQKTIAKSRGFERPEDRNEALRGFVDWVEINIHGNYQRTFNFS